MIRLWVWLLALSFLSHPTAWGEKVSKLETVEEHVQTRIEWIFSNLPYPQISIHPPFKITQETKTSLLELAFKVKEMSNNDLNREAIFIGLTNRRLAQIIQDTANLEATAYQKALVLESSINTLALFYSERNIVDYDELRDCYAEIVDDVMERTSEIAWWEETETLISLEESHPQ